MRAPPPARAANDGQARKLRRGCCASQTMVMRGQATRSNSTPYWRVAARLRVITYIATASSLLLMLVLARLYPDLNRTEIPDWRPLISLADEAANRGDWYGARHLYLQVDRVAYWRQDWEGLVAAACRIHQLDGVNRPYSRALSILFRASMTAERAESRRGVVTVAKSLSLLGSDEAASAVLVRIQPSWPEEAISFDNLTLLGGCSRSQDPDRGSIALLLYNEGGRQQLGGAMAWGRDR